jgi:hypothetical protein
MNYGIETQDKFLFAEYSLLCLEPNLKVGRTSGAIYNENVVLLSLIIFQLLKVIFIKINLIFLLDEKMKFKIMKILMEWMSVRTLFLITKNMPFKYIH